MMGKERWQLGEGGFRLLPKHPEAPDSTLRDHRAIQGCALWCEQG